MIASKYSVRRQRLGFTLVELLITTGIIAILAGLVLFTMVTAQTAAKEAKTKTLIATIEQLLMERYDSYRTRRVSLQALPPGATTEAKRKQRLNGIRRLMQLEMPERWNEINFDEADGLEGTATLAPLSARPGLSAAYKRRYVSGTTTDQHQGAETLYLVVTLACGDGEALEHFKQGDIADTDGDGAKEFIDGWGRPISWLRWPAGFVSERQSRDPVTDHDPFDSYNVDANAYRLIPLVYSSGKDMDYDIVAQNPGLNFRYTVDSGLLNPFSTILHNSNTVQIGSQYDTEGTPSGWIDNVHSHLLETR